MGSKGGGGGDTASSEALARISNQLFEQTDPLRRNLIARSAQFLGASPMMVGGGEPMAGVMPSMASPMLFEDKSTRGQAPSDFSQSFQRAMETQVPAQIPQSTAPMSQPVGPYDVTASPLYEPFMAGLDERFGRARQDIIAGAPAGPGLNAQLGDLTTQRALAEVGGRGEIFGNELDRAMSLATGLLPTATSGLGTSASLQAQQAMAEQQAGAQKAGSMGQAAGMLGAAAIKK